MLIRKILKGHFRIKGITMCDIHTERETHPLNNMVEISFHRQGRWSIFGYREHRNNSYVRKNVGKYNDIFKRKADHTYVSVHRAGQWFVQYHINSASYTIMSVIFNNAYFYWLLYVIIISIVK